MRLGKTQGLAQTFSRLVKETGLAVICLKIEYTWSKPAVATVELCVQFEENNYSKLVLDRNLV